MRFITANRIFSGKEYLADNTALIIDHHGLVLDIVSLATIDSGKVEHFEGIICPGFINAHCHLELSHLKNKIKQHTGIVDFGLNIIKHRNELPAALQIEYMQQADKDMVEQGIVVVGDISNTGLSIIPKQQSSIYYHTFIELISLNPEKSKEVFDAGKQLMVQFEKNQLAASLAPHAPYSTSLQLIEQIMAYGSPGKPTSIHNQESMAENDFFRTGKGDYIRLYDTLNIPIAYFQASHKSSLQTILPSFNAEINTLLVHNTFTDQDDMITAQQLLSKLYWCLCPNANRYIENTLPNVDLLISNKCRLTLGTDSLASNTSLSLIDEINCLLKYKPQVDIEKWLKAATCDGAQAIGVEDKFGFIQENKKPGINLIQKKGGVYSVKKLV